MQYFVYVRRRGKPLMIRDALLPGIIPERVLDLMTARSADDLGIYRDCEVATCCHVMRLEPALSHRNGCGECYSKLCPVLFHDAVRPGSWQVAELA